MGLVVSYASALGNSNRSDRPHPHLLYLGHRPLGDAMEKGALPLRFSLAIFALRDDQHLCGFVPCARLDRGVDVNKNSE